MIESIGWYSALAALISLAAYASKSFLRFVLDKGAEGEQMYLGATLLASLRGLHRVIARTKLASVCSLATLILIAAATESTFFVALGYATIAYAVGGLATPRLMQEVNPLAEASNASAIEPALEPVMTQDVSS